MSKTGLVSFNKKIQPFDLPVVPYGRSNKPEVISVTSERFPATTDYVEAALAGWKLSIGSVPGADNTVIELVEINIDGVVYNKDTRTATASVQVLIADQSYSGDDSFSGFVNILFIGVDEYSPNS